MTKKQTRVSAEDEAKRQSRKDILRARKEAEQKRQIMWAVGGVAGLLILVLIVALVNEFILTPNRAVATVNGEEITIRQWEDRVRYERAQRIVSLENQLEAFGGDVGIIQQFMGQTIVELQDNAALAEGILGQMTDEALLRQAAEARGLTVTDAELDEEIGSFFNYFGGELPTPLPEPTETIAPTPSLTPIPTAVITDVVPTNTPPPTLEPAPAETAPTATPVSKESFDEQLGDLLTQLKDLGVDEATFREVIRNQMVVVKLADALAEEQALPTEAPHASIFLLSFDTEADANEALAMAQTDSFLAVWNGIRSAPADAETTTGTASELLWRTQDTLTSAVGAEAAEAAFVLPPGVPSSVYTQQVDAETTRYHLFQVSGREVRELPAATIENAKSSLLSVFLTEQSTIGSVELFENWRNRVPSQPVLDPKFLAQPTPVPTDPAASDETIPATPDTGQ